MRKFGDLEKTIIDELVESKQRDWHFANYFYKLLYGENCGYKSGTLLSYKMGNPKEIMSFHNKLIEIALFFKFLEDNRYIYFIRNETSSEYKDDLLYYKDQQSTNCRLPKDVSEIIEKSINCFLFVSRELELLKKNDYKTYEEQALEEAQKQTKTSGRTLIVAIVTFLMSVIIPICCNREIQEKKKCIIEKQEIILDKQIKIDWEKFYDNVNYQWQTNREYWQILMQMERLIKSQDSLLYQQKELLEKK